MIHIPSVPVEPQLLDSDTSTISPNSQHVPLLLMPTVSMTSSPKIKKKVSASAKAETK